MASLSRLTLAALPALFIFILTLIISLITGHPEGLFLTRSMNGIPARFVLVTFILVAPIPILPRLLALSGNLVKNERFFGQLVKATALPLREFSTPVAWILIPLQGIALSMIFAERLLNFLEEFSIGAIYTGLLIRSTLFVIGSALVSLFLSIVWALDDLGVKIYNRKTGEVRMVGSSVGTVLPLITGAIGVTSLFHLSSPIDALADLLEIVMVLYPPYVLFAIFHHEFTTRRSSILSGKLLLRRIETNIG